MRSYASSDILGFEGFSPYTLPKVIEISEGIPYIDITGWDHEKLYALKGQIGDPDHVTLEEVFLKLTGRSLRD